MTKPQQVSMARTIWLLASILLACCACKKRESDVPSTFQQLREYRYQEYSSEAECRLHEPNPFYSCTQRISFDQGGRTEAILVESDILLAGNYSISNNSIEATFNQQRGTLSLKFEIVSDSTLRLLDNNSIWKRYK